MVRIAACTRSQPNDHQALQGHSREVRRKLELWLAFASILTALPSDLHSLTALLTHIILVFCFFARSSSFTHLLILFCLLISFLSSHFIQVFFIFVLTHTHHSWSFIFLSLPTIFSPFPNRSHHFYFFILLLLFIVLTCFICHYNYNTCKLVHFICKTLG